MIISEKTKFFDAEGSEYSLLEEIGKGGFGNVYKIIKTSDNSEYALKTIQSILSKENLDAFLNEIGMIQQVKHKNVINYFYIHNGTIYSELPPYIIMEYANGGTLSNQIDNHAKAKNYYDLDLMVNYFHQLIDGMEAINSRLIHRDIKPDNILIKDGEYKITDFGLAKLVEQSTRELSFKGYGTVKYMSPEAWVNGKNSIQMDIYSMGIVFYQLATLKYPYKIENLLDYESYKDAHLYQSAEPPEKINASIDLNISQIIMKMIEKSTSKRYKNWTDIRNDFQKGFATKKINPLISSMLEDRLGKDNQIQKKKLAELKETKEIENFQKSVHSQFINGIIKPIQVVIDVFNESYGDGKISMNVYNKPSDSLTASITLVSRVNLSIELKLLFDKDFIRDVPNGWGGTARKLARPMLDGRKVLAWGNIKSHEKKGFNLILTENKDDIYGNWYMLVNKNNPMMRDQRLPEPFPFEFREIEKEIQCLHALHIYTTDVKAFDINEIIGLIKHYN